MVGVFFRESVTHQPSTGLAVGAPDRGARAGCWLIRRVKPINGAFVSDEFARFMKVLILIGSDCAVMSVDFAKREKARPFELPVLIVLATLGMLLMISANDADRALHGPRTAVAGALCGRRDQPRQPRVRPRRA
jgi:NADH-quinone oxidoreductase subunit N